MRCLVAEPGGSYEWHSHPFEEFTLVTDDRAVIGYGGKKHGVEPNTLCMYRRGERHGGWSQGHQVPRFWVLHFTAKPDFYRQMDGLARRSLRERVWELSADQAEYFKWIFLQILSERTQRRNQASMAESAWLRLLLISVQRWAAGEKVTAPTPAEVRPDLMRLWHVVNSSAGNAEEFSKRIRLVPNYDSLRHAFKDAFGCSPREMMLRMRVQQAKNLLLETTLTIKEISLRLGYERQHEFARAFHLQVGVAPTEWRANPIDASATV
jgi:AraC-like DNA-binding protein